MNDLEFASYLKSVRLNQSGGWHSALCPAHADKRASLSFRDGSRRVRVRCHKGCSETAVLEALGIQKQDLYHDAEAPSRIVKVYPYHDEKGTLLYEVVRFAPKSFRQRRPDGRGGYIWNLDGVRRVLYHLDDLQGCKSAVIVEGEKDADLLRKLGLPATTSPMGAGKWNDDYAAQLVAAGVELVTILPDNDPVGKTHAYQIAFSCLKAGL